MAKFETPINEIDFTLNPSTIRQEEQYLYKFMQMKPVKKPKKETELVLNEDGELEDPELEAFATKEIEAQMKRMQGGDIDTDEELPEDSDPEMEDDEDGESDGEDRFFSDDDDLQEVELEQSDEGEELEEDYGDELEEQASYDDEVESVEEESEEELVEKSKKKGGKKESKKISGVTKYASYEEFAHLLEEGIDNDNNKKDRKHFSNAIKGSE